MGEGAPRGSGTRTVLFTDVVGSTARRSRLGDVAADELERKHDELLRGIVVRHSGTVVKGTGDGIMAVFESAASGAACAAAIQQALDRRARQGGDALEVRVGLATGDVSWERGDYFGLPVNQAARLEASAEGGQILASDLVRLLAGSRTDIRFRPIGSLDLKGLAEPVLTCEVEWEPLGPEATALPPVLRNASGMPFVGRGEELARLAQLWKGALSGERRIAFIAGEPGIGKTRLAAEVARAAQADLATVLYGGCDEEVAAPYRPLVAALRPLADQSSSTELSQWTGRRAGELSRLLPELAHLGTPTTADPETERLLLFEAVDLMLSGASREGGTLLVLDDLHWADRSTVALLRHLARSTEQAALLLVGTYRDSELRAGEPLADLLADLRRDTRVERMLLGGLAAAETAELIAAGTERVADDVFTRRVHAQTDGNPFFVGEVLAHLAEGGVEDDVPAGVREVVGRRLARLPDRSRRALAVASVIGREFEYDLLAEAGDVDESGLLDALDEAVAARLVTEALGPGVRYGFSHALVHATVSGTLTAARRRHLHERVGSALERRYVNGREDHLLPALAHHFSEATDLGEAAKAASYALAAGRVALRQLAYDEAATVLELGLGVLERSDPRNDLLRAELLLALAEAHRGRGDEAAVRRAGELAANAARAVGSVELLARAAVLGRPWTIGGDASSVSDCEEALVLIGDRQPGLRAQLLATSAWGRMAMGDASAAAELGRQAVEIARRLHDDNTLAEVLMHVIDAVPVEERFVLADEEIALGQRRGDLRLQIGGRLERADAALTLGDLQAFISDTEEVRRLGEGWHWWAARRVGETHQALLALLQGRFHDVVAHAEAAVAHAPDDANTLSSYAGQLFLLARERGTLADLKPFVLAAVEKDRNAAAFRSALAMLHVELGELEEARAQLDELALDGFAAVPRDLVWTTSMAMLAEVCAALGDGANAAPVYDLLQPRAGQLVAETASICLGAVDRFLGMLAATQRHWPQAQQHFDAALALEERIGARPLAARTSYWYARMLVARNEAGDRSRATELLDAAAHTAAVLGMPKLVADCEALR